MNPLALSAKLQHMKSNFRRKGLTARQLQEINSQFVSQYEGLTQQELVAKFMRQFSIYLEQDLEDLGYWNNPNEPHQHLRHMAQVGNFGVFVYHGYLPEQHRDILLPHISNKLVQVFNLKKIKGFRIQYIKSKKCSYITSIRLTWRSEREEQEDHDRTVITPDKIIEKVVVERNSQEAVDQMQKDFERSLRHLRRDIEKTMSDTLYTLDERGPGLTARTSTIISPPLVIKRTPKFRIGHYHHSHHKYHNHKHRNHKVKNSKKNYRSEKKRTLDDQLVGNRDEFFYVEENPEFIDRVHLDDSSDSDSDDSFNEEDGMINIQERRKDLF